MNILLEKGLDLLDCSLTSIQQHKLIQYVEQLAKWNGVYNFTAIRDPKEMVIKHLLDSLVVLPFIKAGSVADIGTGAGLPGIPLAIAKPEVQFTLVDTNAKRIRFLHQIIQQLKLSNVTALHCRVESFKPEKLFDQVISRAFTQILPMLEATKHLVKNDGEFLAMKGLFPEDELVDVEKSGVNVQQVVALDVPFLEGDRHLVVLKNCQLSDKGE